jgi:hypothetical protein
MAGRLDGKNAIITGAGSGIQCHLSGAIPGRDKLSQKWLLRSEPLRGGVAERKG